MHLVAKQQLTTTTTQISKFRCNKCKKIGQKASECKYEHITSPHSTKCAKDACLYTENAFKSSLSDLSVKWCLDRRATSNVCKALNKFVNIKDITRTKLHVANESYTDIVAECSVMFSTDVFGEEKNV